MDKIRIAAIQMCSRENRDQNLREAAGLMREAVEHGAQVVSLPENFSFMGSDAEKLTRAEDTDSGAGVRFLSEFAQKNRMTVIGGTLPLKTMNDNRVTNSCLVFDPDGKIAARYDKLHLFDISLDADHTFTESRYVAAGQAVVTTTICNHTIGLSICYDLRFPELYRALTLAGAEVLFVPAAFTALTGRDHWKVLLRTRAIENQCYVVAAAQCGQHNPQRASHGHTMIVDPWGNIVAQCQDDPAVIVSDIDFEYLREVRKQLPCLEHIRLDVFHRR